MKILQIEDNPGDARLILEMLKDQHDDFSMNVADNLADGLEFLKTHDVDILLLDFFLPDSSGLETLLKIKKQYPKLPVVVMTSLDDESLGMQAVRQGAEDYLVKGQTDRRLLRRVFLYSIERKKRQEELNRLNRTLKALSDSNQALMRAEEELPYLYEICKIIVEDCGHAMVWIGYAENDEAKTIRPVASGGFEEGYLATVRLTWADTERGRGPTGTAIRTGKPSTCRNMLVDPAFAPWREEALRRGYASSIAIPLIEGTKNFGVITIYSKESDPFTPEEVQLLTELAEDLSYGIDAIRLRKVHAKTEEDLKQSEKRYRELFNRMNEGLALNEIICDGRGEPCDFRYLDVNPAFERMTGLNRQKIVGKTHTELFPDEDPVWTRQFGTVALKGESISFESYSLALQRYYEIFAYSPALLQFAAIYVDITERKQAENALRQREHEYRLLLEQASDGIILVNESGIIITANSRACELFGYNGSELTGSHARDILDQQELPAIAADINKTPVGQSIILEHHGRRKDGSYLYVETSAIKLADGRFQAIIRDITERKKTEEEFAQAVKTQVFERLFTMLHEFHHGEGLAMNLHRISLFAKNTELLSPEPDIGNTGSPVTVTTDSPGSTKVSPRERFEIAVHEFQTIGYQRLLAIASLMRTIEAELNQKMDTGDEPISGKDIESLAKSLNTDTGELLSIMHSHTPDFSHDRLSTLGMRIAGHVENLYQAIVDTKRQLNSYFTSDISGVIEVVIRSFRSALTDITIDIQNTKPGVTAIISPNELGEVLSLMINNSIDAFSGTAAHGDDRRHKILIRVSESESGVRIDVEDNGSGIPGAVRDLIFTKGFSTKGSDRGRGLSYALSHLSKYGGTLTYDESYHGGARFSIGLVCT